MTIAEMLGQSATMTLLGMGIVFSFLFILIIAVTLMGKIMAALGLTNESAPSVGAPKAATGNAAAVTAAISAAVDQYRRDNK